MNVILPRVFARFFLVAVVAVGLLGLTERSRAASFTLDQLLVTSPTFSNVPGGTVLSFLLELTPGQFDGSLAFDVLVPSGPPASAVSFFSSPSIPTPPNTPHDYGFLNGNNQFLDLYDAITWKVDLGTSPISSVTILFSSFLLSGDPGNGRLTITGLDAPAETPLPGTLPLFLGGLGALALIANRRRKRVSN